MPQKEMVKTDRRCPKCGSRDLHLIEVTLCTITWEVLGGLFDKADGAMEADDTFKVIGRCLKCAHEWRLRNTVHIDQVGEPLEPGDNA